MPSAYVAVRSLRHAGCNLPIQLWHLGPEEMPGEIAAILAKLDVTCIDSFEIAKEHPFQNLKGWQNKIFSIVHCSFAEVLFFDADNFALQSPDSLFDLPVYQSTGTIFWPDFFVDVSEEWAIKPFAWEFLGLPARLGAELESGQLVVDKRKCWAALNLTRHMNERADFYYEKCTYGDKDTFTLAWAALNQPMYVVPHRPTMLPNRIRLQYGPDSSLLFQHARKWKLPPYKNRFMREYLMEDEALAWLMEFYDEVT